MLPRTRCRHATLATLLALALFAALAGPGPRRARAATRRTADRLRRRARPAPGQARRRPERHLLQPGLERPATPASSSPSPLASGAHEPQRRTSTASAPTPPPEPHSRTTGAHAGQPTGDGSAGEPADAGHHVRGQPRAAANLAGGDADDDLHQRHPAVRRALGRQEHHRRRADAEGAGGRRLLLRRQRQGHRHLHRRAAPLHRRDERRHRQLGRVRRGHRWGSTSPAWSKYEALA